MNRGLDCLTAVNYTLALRYRGNHSLSSEMLQFSGFGRVNDLGDYPACTRLAALVNFCVVELFQASGSLVTGTQGLCLPSECSADDLTSVTATLDRVLPDALSTHGKAVLPNAKFSTTLTCGDHATRLSAGGWAVIVVAIGSLLLVIGAGLVQCIERNREMQAQAQSEVDAVAEVVAGAAEVGAVAVQAGTIGEPLFGPRGAAQSGRRPRMLLPLGLTRKLLLAFSPLDNARFLFAPSPAARKFTALEGVRTLSMLWIILAHTLNFFEFVGTDQPVTVVYAQTFGTWPFQAVFAANLAVDSFFVLSGFLGSYVLLRRPRMIGWRAFVFRYMRLTPTLAFVLAAYAAVMPHLGSGPLWYKMARAAQECDEWWWSTLLYVNNVVPAHFPQQCMSWTWYLACDTQMFTLMLPLLWIRARPHRLARRAATALCCLAILGSIACTLLLEAATPGASTKLHDLVYDKSYTRLGPYFVGVLLCFAFDDRASHLPVRMHHWLACLLGLLATGVISAAIWPTYKRTHWWSLAAAVAYVGLSRVGFSVGVALLIWLCISGSCPALNSLLSLRAFDTPAKLTYSAYLVHPIIIRAYYFQRTMLLHYSPVEHLTIFTAMVVYSYAAAMLLNLLVELPTANLIKLLQEAMRTPRRPTQHSESSNH